MGSGFDHSGPDFKEGGIERRRDAGDSDRDLSVLHLLVTSPLDSASVVAALGSGVTPFTRHTGSSLTSRIF